MCCLGVMRMQLTQLIDPRLIRCNWAVSSKKQLLQVAAESLALQSIGVDAHELFECLVRREKLGSTALGLGAAIPHCRSSLCQKVTGFFATLSTPIDFDAPDQRPIDMVFVLLVPGQCSADHVDLLDQVSQLLCRPDAAQQLRQANSDMQLYTTLASLCEELSAAAPYPTQPLRAASA
jgi:PTS system nitrogen regulatory IIA component